MILSETERNILKALANCSFLPGSFENKFPKEIDWKDVSPLQQWHLHRLCIKYRKQIANDIFLPVSQNFITCHPEAPLSRREAQKIVRKAAKEKKKKDIKQAKNSQTKLL